MTLKPHVQQALDEFLQAYEQDGTTLVVPPRNYMFVRDTYPHMRVFTSTLIPEGAAYLMDDDQLEDVKDSINLFLHGHKENP